MTHITFNSLLGEELQKDDSYKIQHTAPGADDAPLHDLKGTFPEDIYTHKAVQYYGHGVPYDQKAVSIIQSARNNPNAKIKIYRAVPKIKSNAEKMFELQSHKTHILKTGKLPKNAWPRAAGNWENSSQYYDFASDMIDSLKQRPEIEAKKISMNPGDWVTTTKEYAKEHGEGVHGKGNYTILSKIVPASHVTTDGNSIHEFGYNPKPNVKKSLEKAINSKKSKSATKDPQGNLKPLYHGTLGVFSSFQNKHISKDQLNYGPGHYFAEDPSDASDYAKLDPYTDRKYTKETAAPNVHKVFVNIKNPFDVHNNEHAQDLMKRGFGVSDYNQDHGIDNTPEEPFDVDHYDTTVDHLMHFGHIKGNWKVISSAINKKLQDLGYDGIVNREKKHWIAFKGNQVAHPHVPSTHSRMHKAVGAIISNLQKGLKGDWQKEGYTLKVKPSLPVGAKTFDPTKHAFTIHTYDPNGKYAGVVAIEHEGNHIFPFSVSVHPDHQRKGIASGMYRHAEKLTGKKIVPEYKAMGSAEPSGQTPDSKALWENKGDKFGKSLEELEKGQNGDWQKEGYEIFASRNPSYDKNGKWDSTFTVYAHHPKDGYVGQAKFYIKNGQLLPDDRDMISSVKVHKDHQRKGLASGMYKEIENYSKLKVQPSLYQSNEAEALWSQPNRPFGKSSEELEKAAGADDYLSAYHKKYPQIKNNQTSGLEVMPNIDNMGSIGSSFNDYKSLSGIREMPISEFQTDPHKLFYDAKDHKHFNALADQIKQNGKISPLIIAIDKKGPYVLEGIHRLAALGKLGAKSFPAHVVLDLDDGGHFPVQKIQKSTTEDLYVPNLNPSSNSKQTKKTQVGKNLFHEVHESDDSTQHILSANDTTGKRHVLAAMDTYQHSDEPHPYVAFSQVSPKFKGKGFGKFLYLQAIKHHGGLYSDSSTSDSAKGVWNWLSKHPDLHVTPASKNEDRHLAVHKYQEDPWTQAKYDRGGETEYTNFLKTYQPTKKLTKSIDWDKNTKIAQDVADQVPEGNPAKELKDLSAVHLFRAYKNTPHRPEALLLKYAVHRIENYEKYKDPQTAAQLDKDFMDLHQRGKANEKNGHITVSNLHNGIKYNQEAVEDVLNHRDQLHNLIRKAYPDHIHKIDGEDHITLARGLSVTPGARGPDHALASYAHNPAKANEFGSHLYTQHVPLKNLWYSYDHGPEEASSSSFGPEDELLVSPHTNKYAYSATVPEGQTHYENAIGDPEHVKQMFRKMYSYNPNDVAIKTDFKKDLYASADKNLPIETQQQLVDKHDVNSNIHINLADASPHIEIQQQLLDKNGENSLVHRSLALNSQHQNIQQQLLDKNLPESTVYKNLNKNKNLHPDIKAKLVALKQPKEKLVASINQPTSLNKSNPDLHVTPASKNEDRHLAVYKHQEDPWTKAKYDRGGEAEYANFLKNYKPTKKLTKSIDWDKNKQIAKDLASQMTNHDHSFLPGALGNLHSVKLFRAYKNTPHSPEAMVLKYIVHRLENNDKYKDPQIAAKLDKDFMDLHQKGYANEKNGHITIGHLHEAINGNPSLISDVLNHRDLLHRLIRQAYPDHIHQIDGEDHITLSRGSTDPNTIGPDHALSSYSHSPEQASRYGTHLYTQHIPLKNVWFSYDHAPEEMSSDNHGPEDEILVSPHEKKMVLSDSIYDGKPRRIKIDAAKNFTKPMIKEAYTYSPSAVSKKRNDINDNSLKQPKEKLVASINQPTSLNKSNPDHFKNILSKIRMLVKSEKEKLEKWYKDGKSWTPEHTDPDGDPNPGDLNRVKGTSKILGNIPVNTYTPQIQKQHEKELSDYVNSVANSNKSDNYKQSVKKLYTKLMSHPDRHVTLTFNKKSSNHEMRLRHLMWGLKGGEGYSITEHPNGGIIISADRHSKNAEATINHKWHYDPHFNSLKFLK